LWWPPTQFDFPEIAPVSRVRVNLLTGQMPFLSPNQQCQSMDGIVKKMSRSNEGFLTYVVDTEDRS